LKERSDRAASFDIAVQIRVVASASMRARHALMSKTAFRQQKCNSMGVRASLEFAAEQASVTCDVTNGRAGSSLA
jgi:hypothetical protein